MSFSSSSTRSHIPCVCNPPVTVKVENTDHEQHQNDLDELDKTLTMKVYLNDQLVYDQSNADQMQQIMEIINGASQKVQRHMDAKNEDACALKFEYVFDVNHTFLHSVFGETNGQTMKQIVDHKLVLILLIISGNIWFVLRFLFGLGSIIYNVYNITVICLLWLPWIVFKHLLFNTVAFKLCLQTFDFWLKVVYGLMFSVALFFRDTPDNIIINGVTLINISGSIYLIANVSLISYVSSFDAVYSTKTNKLVISIFMAFVFSFWYIYSQFLFTDEDDFKVSIQLSNGVNMLSMQSLIVSASRILAIFFWKQSILTWKGKGRAVTIARAPNITWIDTNSPQHNVADIINTTTTNRCDQISTTKQN
eukprot:148011_1